MYNKRYRMVSYEEFGRHNPLYEDLLGSVCYIVYFNVGERGWFLYETGIPYDCPHRIHTTTVSSVEYTDKRVTVTTRNTKFTFEQIEI